MNENSLCLELTERTDSIITELTAGLGDLHRLTWCIVAVGGYGRKELCPFSDIDLLILTDSRGHNEEVQKAIRDMLYPLWDRKFTVGYSVRTIKQAISDTRDDFFFRTSLLDARYLCGRQDMFDELITCFKKDRYFKDAVKFARNLYAHIQKRHDKYGDASYNLEPDIKEGTGSLRDYHCLMWIKKAASYNKSSSFQTVALNDVDTREIEAAADNLIRIRYYLHKLAGRKTDRLSFEYQAPLAEMLGYRDNGNETAAELLMRSFHCSALSIKSITGSVLSQISSELKSSRRFKPRVLNHDIMLSDGLFSFVRPDDVPTKPAVILEMFVQMSEHGGSLSHDARDLVRRSLSAIKAGRNDKACRLAFVKILRGHHCSESLTSMLETGVLEHLLPEFEALKGRTQVDIYHTWTTDLHSIRTLHELHALRKDEHEAFALVNDRDPLYLAALLHDIGKGAGRPHALTGAPIASSIASWLGFSEKDADKVAFLVRHHLLLPDTAYRSDLSEEKVALECAGKARDEKTLAMLYLISIADARATGPRAWDEWKSRLLKELFVKALNTLQRGVLRDPQTMIILEERWNRLIREMPADPGHRRIGCLWALPQAYVIHTETDLIQRHMILSSAIKNAADISLDVKEMGDYSRLTIITKDRTGLFSLLVGVLTINHLDILSAQVFTWLNGTAVDTFHVVVPWKDYSGWDKIKDDFRDACTGNMDISTRVGSTKPLRTESAIRSSSRPQISLDNNFSDFYTLIGVHAPRKYGLLYRTARSISSMKLNIHRAFLSHTGDPCMDVFYVVDELGEKIMDTNMISAVEHNIIKAIS